MNKSLRDSIMEQQKIQTDSVRDGLSRIERVEHRLMELNNAYDGVMKELLDMKSILQDSRPKRAPPIREPPAQKPPEVRPREEPKQAEKPKPKGEYIIAEKLCSAREKETASGHRGR